MDYGKIVASKSRLLVVLKELNWNQTEKQNLLARISHPEIVLVRSHFHGHEVMDRIIELANKN